jgi:hypothetical protein
MNSARDLLRSYMEILSEAPAAPAPTPKAGLAQAPADGAMRPTSVAPTTIDSAERKGEKLEGGDGFNQNVPGQYSYDTEGGRKVTGNKIWGTQTVSDADGARTYDASGQKIGYDAPSSQGMSGSVDTRTGDVTQSFNAGDVGVTATKGASGQTKALSTRNTMGAVDVDADWKAPEYEKGQLASPTITNVTAKTDADGGKETAQLATGVGFGGASGKNVGNNTIATGNQDLANMAKRAGGGVDLSKAANAPETQMAADQRASLQSFANKDYKDPAQPAQAAQGQQPVSEEDTHEHPESARHLLKKLLKLLKDEDKIEEGGWIPGTEPYRPKFTDQMKQQGVKDPTNKFDSQKSDSPKSDAPKKSAENDKDDGEEKIAESLMHLYKAIKEGRIQ